MRPVPQARLVRLAGEHALGLKLEHEDFAARARAFARSIADGCTFEAAADGAGLRRKAARQIQHHPEAMARLLREERPEPAATRTSISVDEIREADPDVDGFTAQYRRESRERALIGSFNHPIPLDEMDPDERNRVSAAAAWDAHVRANQAAHWKLLREVPPMERRRAPRSLRRA